MKFLIPEYLISINTDKGKAGQIIFATRRIFFKILFIYSWETERERQRKKQAPHREPDVGLDPRTPGSCPEPKADIQPLSPPGVPLYNILYALPKHSPAHTIYRLQALPHSWPLCPTGPSENSLQVGVVFSSRTHGILNGHPFHTKLFWIGFQ